VTEAVTTFRVRLAQTGREFVVPADRSIARVLQEAGVDLPTSCEQGICGTCRTRYLEGEPEHNDFVLTPQEQESELMPCCARSFSELLVLDL
jgi:vanillate O-demethylase ferredoxin subunit